MGSIGMGLRMLAFGRRCSAAVSVRTYVRAREPFIADEDDHTKMNARVL